MKQTKAQNLALKINKPITTRDCVTSIEYLVFSHFLFRRTPQMYIYWYLHRIRLTAFIFTISMSRSMKLFFTYLLCAHLNRVRITFSLRPLTHLC